MLILGMVIENITHEKYFDYLKKNIFEPADMKNTDGFDKDRPVKNLATGYTKGTRFFFISYICPFEKSGRANSI